MVSLDCDVPAGGVADVNVLVTDIVPDKPLRFFSDAPDGEFFRLIDVPVERNTGPDAFTERDGGPLNAFVTRRAPFRAPSSCAMSSDMAIVVNGGQNSAIHFLIILQKPSEI